MIKRKGLPNQNELVMCTVDRITPYAAWCRLDEYDAEGMIHVSEAASKWVQDIREHVKTGKQYVAKVVKVDPEKKMVNISLKRVSKRDEKEKNNAFRQEQRSEKILEQAGQQLGKNLRQSYDEVGYLLQEKFGELSTAFEEAKADRAELEKAGAPKKWVDALLPIVEKALKDKETLLKVELDIRSYEGDGIDRVKSVISALKKSGLGISYISAPKYVAEVKTKDPKAEEKKMRERLDVFVESSRSEKVEFSYSIVK